MEPHTRRRFHFASSAFSRIFGIDKVTAEMIDFCYNWALQDKVSPLDCLNHTDRYFRELWTESHN